MTAPTLQDAFLGALHQAHVPVSIYLVNGIKLQGQIDGFDQYAILLKSTTAQLVYKHAISSVLPSRSIAIQRSETPPERNTDDPRP